MSRQIVRVSAESFQTIKEVASEREVDFGAATDILVRMGRSRRKALRNYDEKMKGKKPKKPSKVKVKRTSKAKGG